MSFAPSWTVRVHGASVAERRWSLPDLATLDDVETTATLDCTSGWAMTTSWRGTPLSSLLRASGADPASASVVVRSVTGWSTSLGPADTAASLLATRVGGRPLPSENGAPCRLVAPTRRGVDWVKWVADIEVVG